MVDVVREILLDNNEEMVLVVDMGGLDVDCDVMARDDCSDKDVVVYVVGIDTDGRLVIVGVGAHLLGLLQSQGGGQLVKQF